MKKILLQISFVLMVTVTYGQKVSVESSTQQIDSVKFTKLFKSYNRIIMAEREESVLIKVDLLGPLLYVMSGIDSSKNNVMRLSYEQKFRPEWSWIVAVDGQADKRSFTEIKYRGGARYYFNMEKRILRRKSANNFSANYFSTRFNYKTRPNKDDDQISLDLLFGIQRRIWKYGFVDFDIGVENIISPFEGKTVGVDFTSSIQIGIAF